MSLSDRSGERFRRRFIGRVMPVLIEKAEQGLAEGLTPNYQRVVFAQDDPDLVRENELVDVVLETVTAEGFSGRLQKK